MKWISIKDQKPPRGHYILVTDIDSGFVLGIISTSFKPLNAATNIQMYTDTSKRMVSPSMITHWMMLSEVPVPRCDKCDTVCLKCESSIILVESEDEDE